MPSCLLRLQKTGSDLGTKKGDCLFSGGAHYQKLVPIGPAWRYGSWKLPLHLWRQGAYRYPHVPTGSLWREKMLVFKFYVYKLPLSLQMWRRLGCRGLTCTWTVPRGRAWILTFWYRAPPSKPTLPYLILTLIPVLWSLKSQVPLKWSSFFAALQYLQGNFIIQF